MKMRIFALSVIAAQAVAQDDTGGDAGSSGKYGSSIVF